MDGVLFGKKLHPLAPRGKRLPGPRAARSSSRIDKRLTPSGGGGRWAYEHKNEEAIEMLQAAGVNEDAKDRGSRPSRPAHCAAAALPPPRRPSAYRRHYFLPFAPS